MRKFTDALPARILLPAIAAHALALADARAYEDGAPPGHTGGFGEADCSVCHADNETNAAQGSLTLEERPGEAATAGRRLFVIVLDHPRLRSGGFQLAVRTLDGEPAGRPAPLSERTRVITEGEQPYLQHAREGRTAGDDGKIRWQFEWTPPTRCEDVVLHLAANAANDDLSALGDFIFTLEKKVAPCAAADTPPRGGSPNAANSAR